MGKLPHSIQATLQTDSAEVWSSLRPEGMTVNVEDLWLEQGSQLAGEFVLIGVLTAMPGTGHTPAATEAMTIPDLSDAFAGITRPLMGRPAHSYGVAPLMIYREIRRRAGGE
jgi:hypothetical protein